MPTSSESPPSGAHSAGTVGVAADQARPLLSVVVPVYNGGDEIVANVEQIRRSVELGLPGSSIEVIVVSDGSIDGTDERLLRVDGDQPVRVIHYDRNLGKGYAVKLGALAAHGTYVALVDADLDLDPASIPDYLRAARRDDLDFAIGSKRHPDSRVAYPRSRRVASWWYQQLNRLLFRLDVRDTQVGLKVFHRRVVDEIIPLLLVKQFAFDLELLAVAAALGRGRVRELPVRLDYRFSGSALGSAAVARALWDTLAIFYRLRVLRTYQRKRTLLPRAQALEELPLVSVISSAAPRPLDYPHVEWAAALGDARGDVLGVLRRNARPAGNWLTATIPYLADDEVAAVVTPTVAPVQAPLAELVAAAVLESRLGGGSRRSIHFPGNVKIVDDYSFDGLVVRRADYVAAVEAHAMPDGLVAWLAARGRKTVYTPDTSVAARPEPLVRRHLSATFAHGLSRGCAARSSGGRSLSRATALSLVPVAGAAAGSLLLTAGTRAPGRVGATLLLAYGGALAASGVHAGVRFRSATVALLEPPAVVASQLAYAAGFLRGLTCRDRMIDDHLPSRRSAD
jgi:glycosyltransferase involved in cell wall biosynthesis